MRARRSGESGARRRTVRIGTTTEYWFADDAPRPGETLVRRGVTYVVTSMETDGRVPVVTVEEVDRVDESGLGAVEVLDPI